MAADGSVLLFFSLIKLAVFCPGGENLPSDSYDDDIKKRLGDAAFKDFRKLRLHLCVQKTFHIEPPSCYIYTNESLKSLNKLKLINKMMDILRNKQIFCNTLS